MAANYRFIVPGIRSSNTLIVKSNFYESLANSRIEHPKVIPAKTRSDLHEAGKELGYPIFVWPCMSQTFADIVGSKGFLARSEGELVNCFTIAADAGLEVILQELIPGPGTNNFAVIGYFNDLSRPLALFSYRRLRAWPTILGNSCLAESFPISSVRSVVDTLVKYLVDLRYQGLFEAEFKRDPRDGGYKLLEINARSSWQNSFPTKCGLNIIHKAYLDSIGLGGDYTEDYSAGVKWINLVEDMAASFAAKEILKTSWVRSFMGTKQHAFFDPDDPAPALITLLFDLGLIDTTRGRLRPAIVKRTLQSTKNLPIQ